MAPASRPKPGRYLALVALALVGLYLGVFLGPSKTPALGLDLRGGTEVTEAAQPIAGGKVDKAALNQAVNIIRERVDGLGVGGATISTQGNKNIVIAVPGKGRDQVVKTVGQTALLRFRQVLQTTTGLPASATTTPSPSVSTSPSASAKPSSKSSSKRSTTKKSTKKSTKKKSSGDAVTSALLKASPSASSSPDPSSSVSPSAAPDPAATAGTSASASPTATSSTAASPGASPSASPSLPPSAYEAPSLTPALTQAYNDLNCVTTNDPTQGQDLPSDYIVACDPLSGASANGLQKYLLAPSTVAGTDIKSASASLQQNSVALWQVNLTFTGSGSGKWQALTAKAYNADPATSSSQLNPSCAPPTGCNAVAIVLDGVVQSAPYISQSGGIPGGQAQITGNFTQKSSSQLAEVLKFGALPLKFTQEDVQSVSATLGSAQLRGGLIAGAIGLGLVVLFSLLYYRALGFVTVGSLAVSGALLYAVTTLLGHSSLGYTLSLPGIAGFIVAVGITADSFVVFFERLRDEIREGRRLRSGVERAWPRARRTIISADFVSLLAAVVLYIVSIGDVRGFAFTLGLSTISDLFIVFFFTKPLLTLLARVSAFDSGKAWTGVGKARGGVVRDVEPVARRRRTKEA